MDLATSSCSNDTCGQYIINPLADSIYTGDLGQDLISISPKQPLSPFLSAVIDSDDPLQNLPKQSKGIMGLARTQLSFPKQMNTQKFALCLPSSSPNSKGIIFIGDSAPQSLTQFTFSTPLITNPVSTSPVHTQAESSYEYYINVTSISVYGDPVHFDTSYLSIDKKGNGGTKISTMTPYTKLHNDILKPLVRNFAKKASDRKIRRVESVGPFRACFDKTTIRETREGLDVPFIMMKVDGSTFWGIYGRNLMVEVEENVVCLAFVDGGKVRKGASGVASVVIGGYTLEDIYLEFDLGSSKFSFGDSLFLRNETCSLYSTTSTSVSSF
ncbi:basic 7S globulin [Senna tora]|uniref:Basic 7S globulin n=1 Tax=Senna tora TaxID=362788 RepID=A0A834SZS9_9FABA|nr:basic 7S globulin [Senna tora]